MIEGISTEVINDVVSKSIAFEGMNNKEERDYLAQQIQSFWDAKGAGSVLHASDDDTEHLRDAWEVCDDFTHYDSEGYSVAFEKDLIFACNAKAYPFPRRKRFINQLEKRSATLQVGFNSYDGDSFPYELHKMNAQISMIYICYWKSIMGEQWDISKAGTCVIDRMGCLIRRTPSEHKSKVSEYQADEGAWLNVIKDIVSRYTK